MADADEDERIIMIMAEPPNGDGYVFATADPQRAIELLEEWSAKFGAERVQCNEGFEALARPLMDTSNKPQASRN